MDSRKYLKKMKMIQENILFFLEEDNDFQKLKDVFEELKIFDDRHDFMSFLHLLLKISNNHHRGPNFLDRIHQILRNFQDYIKKYYSNSEIFNTFKSNKQILLFLLEQKIMVIDYYIIKIITTEKYINAKYPQYFAPEILQFINEECIPENTKKELEKLLNEYAQKIPDDFYENRKIGENDTFICKLIRNDSVIDFIAYVNRNNCSLSLLIDQSIYETNNFLLKQKDVNLIEYATFFGSIQIIQYLIMNNIELASSLWIFAIHSQNPEIIHRFEENQIVPINNELKFSSNSYSISYKDCFKESIKCHHNDFANYIQISYLQKSGNISNDDFIKCIKYYNFEFIQTEVIDETSLYDLCKYGYYFLVKIRLNDKDINKYIILFAIILIKFKIKSFNGILS